MRDESGKVNWNQITEVVLIRTVHFAWYEGGDFKRFDIDLQFRLTTLVTVW